MTAVADYPSEETLAAIEAWPLDDIAGLIDRIAAEWHWPEYFTVDGHRAVAVTGGWSGNESLIDAFQQNEIAWSLCWQASYRGGKHEFELPEFARK
jgi:hypothetical protein